MNRLFRYSLTAAAFSLLVGCGGSAVVNESSVLPEAYVNPAFVPVPSTISVPVVIQPAWIENLVNDMYKDVIYKNDSIGIIPGVSSAQFTVTKAEPVRIGLLGDELHYRLPVKLNLRVVVGVSSFGLSLSNAQEVEGAIALRMRSTISINPDWSLATKTYVDGYDWISSPSVKVGPVAIPFTPVADLLLGTMKGSAGAAIDKSIRKNVDLRKQLAGVWNTIQRPMLVDQNTGLWLRMVPDSLFMTQLHGNNGAIVSSLGVKTVAESFFGVEPPAPLTRQLPGLVIRSSVDSGFVLNLFSEMPFSQAQILARQNLCAKSFPMAGKSVTVDSIWINGDSGLVKIDVALSGDFKGTVSLVGRPELDTVNRVFQVADPVFTMETRNVLLKTAKWLFNGTIQKLIAEQLRFPLDPQLATAKSMVNAGITTYKPMKDVSFSGGVDSLAMRGFALTGTGMKVAVLAKGKLGVRMVTLLP